MDERKIIQVVAAVIIQEGHAFVTQRGYGEYKDKWEFPGGKIQEGETPQDALIREIKEELDTEIVVGRLIDTVEYDYPEFHLSMQCFWCKIKAGTLDLKEHEAAQWLTSDELFNVDWLPADKIILPEIRNAMRAWDNMAKCEDFKSYIQDKK